MIAQLKELVDKVKPYTPIVNCWFDGGSAQTELPLACYGYLPDHQISGARLPDRYQLEHWFPENVDAHPVLPEQQKAGFPIRYFPSDFRLGDSVSAN